jgi:hypothetical protein
MSVSNIGLHYQKQIADARDHLGDGLVQLGPSRHVTLQSSPSIDWEDVSLLLMTRNGNQDDPTTHRGSKSRKPLPQRAA